MVGDILLEKLAALILLAEQKELGHAVDGLLDLGSRRLLQHTRSLRDQYIIGFIAPFDELLFALL
jgi:hypothetical protein